MEAPYLKHNLKTKLFVAFPISHLTGGNPVKDPQKILSMACSSNRMAALFSRFRCHRRMTIPKSEEEGFTPNRDSNHSDHRNGTSWMLIIQNTYFLDDISTDGFYF